MRYTVVLYLILRSGKKNKNPSDKEPSNVKSFIAQFQSSICVAYPNTISLK